MLASLRLATSRDAAECLEIYRPFVESSHTTFETDVPSADAFARRIENYGATYPWIVSVDDAGTVTGAPRALRDCRAEAEAWIRGA
jgi:phosphinothricin acetyltransferase